MDNEEMDEEQLEQEKWDRETDDYLLNIIMQNENSTGSKTANM